MSSPGGDEFGDLLARLHALVDELAQCHLRQVAVEKSSSELRSKDSEDSDIHATAPMMELSHLDRRGSELELPLTVDDDWDRHLAYSSESVSLPYGSCSSMRYPFTTLYSKTSADIVFGHVETSVPDRKFHCRQEWLVDRVTLVELESRSLGRQITPMPAGDRRSTNRQSLTDRIGFFCCTLFHPYSPLRHGWVILYVMFVIYDLCVVPVEFGFDFQRPTFMAAIQLIENCFWSLDIVLTFFTGMINNFGRIEMQFNVVAVKYLKSWFLFDLLLVLLDWTVFVLADGGHSSASLWRTARIIRLTRVVRLFHFLSLIHLLRDIAARFQITAGFVNLYRMFVSSILRLIFVTHIAACLWHFVGYQFEDGWVNRYDLNDTPAGWRYAFSLHWTINRLHGLSTASLMGGNAYELAVDSLLVFGSIMVATVFMSQVNAAAVAWTVLWRDNRLRGVAHRFTWRHTLSEETHERIMKFLQASHSGGAHEVLEDEFLLIDKLPVQLQRDVLYQVHSPVLRRQLFFERIFALNPRALRHLCAHALVNSAVVHREMVFAQGDVCDSVLFVRSGLLLYEMVSSERHTFAERKWSSPSEISGQFDYHSLGTKSSICEIVLWVAWEHTGSLRADEDSMLIMLSANKFCTIIEEHVDAYKHACLYAKRFVWNLNHGHNLSVSDLTTFEITEEELDHAPHEGTELDHFIFISHYKVEAGTEATLIRDSIESIIRHDERHPGHDLLSPIFIDSEDLVDLTLLKDHVRKSRSLLLLLTPGLLSRPWCLLEIVTALRSDVTIVPVEIQRPGMKYQYPDDRFYEEFLRGDHVSSEGIELLEQEGVQLQEVAAAIRKVFMKIALPFSPHKTRTVRDAEINDVLKRC